LGGPVEAGVPYTVGERGRELFVPEQDGTIIPNNRLVSGAGPATSAVVNITNNWPAAVNPAQVQRALRIDERNNGPR
jgi:hypothetical protein